MGLWLRMIWLFGQCTCPEGAQLVMSAMRCSVYHLCTESCRLPCSTLARLSLQQRSLAQGITVLHKYTDQLPRDAIIDSACRRMFCLWCMVLLSVSPLHAACGSLSQSLVCAGDVHCDTLLLSIWRPAPATAACLLCCTATAIHRNKLCGTLGRKTSSSSDTSWIAQEYIFLTASKSFPQVVAVGLLNLS